MAKTAPAVILLRINDEGSRPILEKIVDTAAKPGMLLKMVNNSGDLHFDLQDGSDVRVAPIVAIESPYFGENTGALAGTYVATNQCRAQVLQPGDEAYVLCAANEDIAIGDMLNAGGTGHWAEVTTAANTMAVALEAATSTSAFLCRVMIF